MAAQHPERRDGEPMIAVAFARVILAHLTLMQDLPVFLGQGFVGYRLVDRSSKRVRELHVQRNG